MSTAIATGALAAVGVYLLLHKGLVRKFIGFFLLQHAVNLLLVTTHTPQRTQAPILPVDTPSDPLGQAFVLTAIIIGFGSMIFLLAITLQYTHLRQTEQDSEDKPVRDDDLESKQEKVPG